MEELIRIIIYLIEQAAKSRERRRIAPPSPEQIALQKAILAQRAAAAQRTMAPQNARPRPPANRRAKPAARPIVPKSRQALSQPSPTRTAPWAEPLMKSVAPVTQATAPKTTARPEWQIPLVLAEVLAPPLALREPEF